MCLNDGTMDDTIWHILSHEKIEDRCYCSIKDTRKMERSLGTLGGGNHFIEVPL